MEFVLYMAKTTILETPQLWTILASFFRSVATANYSCCRWNFKWKQRAQKHLPQDWFIDLLTKNSERENITNTHDHQNNTWFLTLLCGQVIFWGSEMSNLCSNDSKMFSWFTLKKTAKIMQTEFIIKGWVEFYLVSSQAFWLKNIFNLIIWARFCLNYWKLEKHTFWFCEASRLLFSFDNFLYDLCKGWVNEKNHEWKKFSSLPTWNINNGRSPSTFIYRKTIK